jgi:hypothetical protein
VRLRGAPVFPFWVTEHSADVACAWRPVGLGSRRVTCTGPWMHTGASCCRPCMYSFRRLPSPPTATQPKWNSMHRTCASSGTAHGSTHTRTH